MAWRIRNTLGCERVGIPFLDIEREKEREREGRQSIGTPDYTKQSIPLIDLLLVDTEGLGSCHCRGQETRSEPSAWTNLWSSPMKSLQRQLMTSILLIRLVEVALELSSVYYAELQGEATREFLAELKVLTHVHHLNLTAEEAMTPIESTFSLDVNSKLDWLVHA
ncbi:hypothetical protein Vadar_013076 [Vaccinium darrowii]|uniref:Uncharacterized protein n=1 Tax=Vaccinium darrowii TaxID=229202 RepID=A0ACB7Y6D2_9ERIC|nr:hypothetical protein Vadar_013076 [Vaccinium darrowii]